MRPLKYISLFSGIEAATVAWKPLGWEPIAFAEIDPFSKAVLAHHYPGVPDLGDMTKVDWRKYRGTVDLVCGGSPCQAFSVAGLRKALDDSRGQLMLEYLRACYEIDPEWVVWENVPGVLSADKGRAFGSLLEGVAELWPDGGAAWRVLDAQFFGVAQRRRRVFFVVNTRDWRRAAPVLFEREGLCWDYQSSAEARKAFAERSNASSRAASSGIDGAPGLQPLEHRVYCASDTGVHMSVVHDLAPTLTAHDSKSACFINAQDFSVRRLTPVECERLQGFPDGYTDVRWRGKEHAPDSKRYKALGNSMAVPVMRWIGEGIELVDNSER